jgi:GNAT superfamily N-acetyltransferase
MNHTFEIVDIGPENVAKLGFFCYMSKPKSPGYKQKREWLDNRFAEGLKIKIVHEHGGRDVAFIEYIPGEYAWRAVNAPGYLVIHCMWVVGKGKGKGYGRHLLQACLEEARLQGKRGIVMISSDQTWLAKKGFFLNQGFEQIAQTPPSFQLLVRRFDETASLPSFPDDWGARQAAYGPGLTIVRTAQCPYIQDATDSFIQLAQDKNVPARVVKLSSAQELQQTAPCAYGVFGVVFNGRLLTYHPIKAAEFEKCLSQK